MAKDHNSYPLIEEDQAKFYSISDIPLHLCTISLDSKEFLVYDVENNKICAKISNPMPYKLVAQGCLCELNGSQLFYLGGYRRARDSIVSCVLIDIKTQSAERLRPCRPRTFATPVYFENFIYVFGGSRSTNSYQAFSDKFSLRKNKWKIIADLPAPSRQTYAIVYERKILVSGRNLGNIWNYDPDKNSYESLFELEKEPWKMFLINKNQCYVMTSDHCCYASEEGSIKGWTFYGKFKGIIWPCSNTYFYNEGMMFFDQNSRVCKFDFNKFDFEVVGRTKDTQNIRYIFIKKSP